MGMPVTVKGQVTIPKPIRDRLGLTPGCEVDFAIEADGRVFLRKAGQGDAAASGRLGRLRPAPGWNGMTTDEIMKLTRGED
jgi:antitoxin PrlF